MSYDPDQLAALRGVIEEGTFDAAARRLSLTQSAVSQRIKALESRVGRVLVVRSTPCRPTAEGERMVWLARQIQLISAETTASIGAEPSSVTTLPVAVTKIVNLV